MHMQCVRGIRTYFEHIFQAVGKLILLKTKGLSYFSRLSLKLCTDNIVAEPGISVVCLYILLILLDIS